MKGRRHYQSTQKKRMNKEAMQELLRRPIAYHPIVAKAFGSIQLAVFWSQLYYWSDKTEKEAYGWIYKTSPEIFKETGLKRRGQETARNMGVKLGVLQEERRGMPAKMHFKVDMDKSIELIEAYIQGEKKGKKKEKKSLTETDGGLLNKLMEKFQIVNPSYERLYAQTTQRKALDRMMVKFGYEQTEAIINFLPLANGNKFSGVNITTPYQLESNLGKLKAWADKQKQNAKAKKVLI